MNTNCDYKELYWQKANLRMNAIIQIFKLVSDNDTPLKSEIIKIISKNIEDVEQMAAKMPGIKTP